MPRQQISNVGLGQPWLNACRRAACAVESGEPEDTTLPAASYWEPPRWAVDAVDAVDAMHSALKGDPR